MIDLKKNILCENINEYLFIKKLLINNGFKDVDENSPKFPGYFYEYLLSVKEFTFWKYYKVASENISSENISDKKFITAKQIIREIKLNKIND